MTSLLVSSLTAALFAALVHSCRALLLDSSSSSSSSSVAFAANAATATAATTQLPKTFDQIYRETICNNQRSCHLLSNVSSGNRTLAERNCMCDAECNFYGDCCFDSPFYNEEDQKTNFKLFHCPKENWYMKASCLAGYPDQEIIRRCAEGLRSSANDVRIITPVTDLELNVTYANVYCAMCDNRNPQQLSLRPWNVTFRCEVNATASTRSATAAQATVAGASPTDEAEASAVAQSLSWDDTLNEYRAYYRGRAYKCQPLRQPPTGISGLRQCVPVVSSCPETADQQLAADCESFALYVYTDSLSFISYRNIFCAQCNKVTEPLVGCRPKPEVEDRFSTPQRIFSGTNKATGNAACSDPNVNPDLKKRFCPS